MKEKGVVKSRVVDGDRLSEVFAWGMAMISERFMSSWDTRTWKRL